MLENAIGGVRTEGYPTSGCLDMHRMKDRLAGTVAESIVVGADEGSETTSKGECPIPLEIWEMWYNEDCLARWTMRTPASLHNKLLNILHRYLDKQAVKRNSRSSGY
jgi:hypothetical protein